MRTINSLTKGDYIAFGFNYKGIEPKEIMVSNITEIYEDSVLTHFLYGFNSLAEFVKKEDILAIGNLENGDGKISG